MKINTKLTLSYFLLFWISILQTGDAAENREFLRRVKRIIGNAKPVNSKSHKFQHVVTLLGKYTDYKVKSVFGFLKVSVPYPKQVHCGASLLSNNYVITAAHCLFNSDGEYRASSKWIIYINGIRRKPNVIERFQAWMANRMKLFGVKRPKDLPFHAHPKEFFVHPDYDKLTYNNDIAIIKIKPVNLEEIYDSGPIRLPPPEVIKVSGPEPEETCWYAGWGCTAAKGDVTESLLEAEFEIKKLDVCVNTFAGATKEGWKDYLCAQAPSTAICSGDSGGGLSCRSKSGKMYLAGIASTGAAGNNPEKFPSNFMKVSNYVDWIKSVTNLN